VKKSSDSSSESDSSDEDDEESDKNKKRKAEEIDAKAEEEFNIEKQRLLQAEKIKIMRDYERKEKQVETQKKIAYSNELNQARLRVLKSREDSVNKVLHDAFRELTSVSQSHQYKDLLLNLTVQAAIKIDEPQAFVLCREVDHALVQSFIPKVCQEYKKLTGKDLKLTIDTNNRLNPPRIEGNDQPACAGGIMLSTAEGRIICNNTLEQRLSMTYDQLLPNIRIMMFGPSIGRQHFS